MLRHDPIAQRLQLLELSSERVLATLKDLVHLIQHLPESITMALKPEVQAAVDRIKQAIVDETNDIKTKLQTVIDGINAGNDPAETVAALDAIVTDIAAVSEAVIPQA